MHGGDLPQRFSRRHRLLEKLLRLSMRLPDAIVVLARSEFEAYRNFVPGQRVVAVPNAIDYTPYAQTAHASVDPAAPLRLLYIGRLSREKGLFEAMNGLRFAHSQGSKARWFIAGSGPDEMALRQFAKDLRLSEDVIFVGPAFGAAKMALLNDADVLVLPSYAEGLPYALLEAMAAGMPAITTRVGAIPDVVVDGLHGLFVPLKDSHAIGEAILHLDDNRPLLADMRVACRQRIVSGYTVDRLADAFADLYSDHAATRPAQAAVGS
jgi:glycosyltransferase involved in cell wall biosynthesis